MSVASNHGSPAHTSKRSSSNDSLKKDAMSRDVDKDKEIRALREEIKGISSNNNELQRLLKRSKDKVTQLDLRINTLQCFEGEAKRVKNEYYELEKKYIKLENDNKRLNTEILSLKRKTDAMDSVQSKLDRSENDKRFLERTIEQLRRQVYDLEEEKRKVRERKKIGKRFDIFC
jgi:chromosome segregation ATPase